MPDRVKFTNFTNADGSKQAVALDKISFDPETKKLTMYSSIDGTIKEETTIPATDVEVDDTLAIGGKAADSKAAGDAIKDVIQIGGTPSEFTGMVISSTSEEVDLVEQSVFDAEIAKFNAKVGSPLVATTASAMTDTTKIYVYTGSETGYTSGNWYYYNGSAWTSGGVYNSVAIETDKTLTVENMAADAKATGDEIDALKEDLSGVSDALGTFLRSYVVTGRVKFDKNTILQSAKAQSGTYTFYKFTKNFLKFDDATKNGIALTHSSDGKIVLNGTATANTDFTVELPVTLTGQFYGYIKGSESKGIYIYLRQASAIGAQMTLATGTSDSFDRNVSYIVRYQMIILSGATFDNYELEASVEYLFNETHANNPYYYEKPVTIEQATFPIESDVDYFLSALTTSQILLDTKFLSGKTAVRVSKTNGGDYSSILDALKATPDYVKIYVENGTYNIVEEYESYYGSDFWSNYDGYANHANDPFYRGLWVSDDRVIECDAWVKIVWDYDGTNASVNGLFSVFATGQNATIINAHVIFNSNCRYAIHDDYAAFGGTNKFIGCIFDGASSNGTTIGGGCGHRNTYVIKDCLFLNDGTYDISYHNTSGLGINHIIVTGCNGGGQLKFGWYGNSTEITECIASNNKFGSIVCEAHNSSATNQNMRLSAWNNEVA